MKIGIGVITVGLRPIGNYRLGTDSELYIFHDKDRKGPAYARNQCLRYFYDKGFDYIFLFDDDCRPVMDNWEKYFIDQANEAGVNYMAVPEYFKTGFKGMLTDEMALWDGTCGCFTYQTRYCLDTIGGYNNDYFGYGLEDAGRSKRALRAGMTEHPDHFSFPIRGLAYIYSEDIFGVTAIQNLTMEEKLSYVHKNQGTYNKEINGEKLFYDF